MVGNEGCAFGWKLSTSIRRQLSIFSAQLASPFERSKSVHPERTSVFRHTLRDHALHDTELSELCNGLVPCIRPSLQHVGPSQKAPRPVSLAHLMVLAELIIIDGPIRLVQGIRPLGPSVVGETRGHRYARAREQQRLSILASLRRSTLRRGQEFCKGSNSARGCACARGNYAWCRQRGGIRDAQQRGTNGGHCSCARPMVKKQVEPMQRRWRRSTKSPVVRSSMRKVALTLSRSGGSRDLSAHVTAMARDRGVRFPRVRHYF